MSFDILCADGVEWSEKHKGEYESVLTGLPDMDEVNMTRENYIAWFRKAAKAVIESVKPDGYIIFIQTDRKQDGLIDKSYLLNDVAHGLSMKILFHKIALRRNVDATDLFRPTYSHIMCYSKKGTAGTATPDVFMRGDVLYSNGTGTEAAKRMLRFLQTKKCTQVVDPFVGRGTVLLLAKEMGFASGVGIDIDSSQCEKTKEALSMKVKATGTKKQK